MKHQFQHVTCADTEELNNKMCTRIRKILRCKIICAIFPLLPSSIWFTSLALDYNGSQSKYYMKAHTQYVSLCFFVIVPALISPSLLVHYFFLCTTHLVINKRFIIHSLQFKIDPSVNLLCQKTIFKHFLNNFDKVQKTNFYTPKLSKLSPQNRKNEQIFDRKSQFLG